ncbi:hypothetical protein [Fusobacterium polymorphum]|uniref:hypothetical protein n=1 Tax=Fusobacterium nucleatum subsp. polymorphum TaxID=76857 RepID=UPI0030CC7BC8
MLEEIDIEILKFINQFGEVSKDKILNAFPENKFSTSYRISYLEEKEYKDSAYNLKIPIPNTNYIESLYDYVKNEHYATESVKLDIYYLTDLGKTFLQDHNLKVKKQKKDFFKQFLFEIMRSIFCPLIVALLTTLITLFINQKFLQ